MKANKKALHKQSCTQMLAVVRYTVRATLRETMKLHLRLRTNFCRPPGFAAMRTLLTCSPRAAADHTPPSGVSQAYKDEAAHLWLLKRERIKVAYLCLNRIPPSPPISKANGN